MHDVSRDRSSPGTPAGAARALPATEGMDRRSFLKHLGVAGAALAAGAPEAKGAADEPESLAVLVDTTRCAGCRMCEASCAAANGLPEPDLMDTQVFEQGREPSETQWTVVNRYATEKGEVFAKKQCMHCLQPACGAACLTRAMYRTSQGPVVWREGKCMGCRFCMVSCPFDVPRFEYQSANPRIQKCQMCAGRVQNGELPACVENCPSGALMFGKRSELLAEAHRRMAESPDQYVPAIYGEQEVGGTSWLYMASVPFDQLGFRVDLGETPYPDLTKEFLYGVPVALILVPAFLLSVSTAIRGRHESDVHEVNDARREKPSTEAA